MEAQAWHRGEVAEVGGHSEVLKRGGVYATLFRFQQLRGDNEPADVAGA